MISTPAPPDPFKTAQAQSQWNNTTAQTQQALNMVDQYSPTGSSVYDQTGTQTIIGADGQPVTVPKYTQTTKLSSEQQGIFDKTQQAQASLAGLAADQSATMRGYLKTPFSFNNHDAEKWSYDLGAQRLDPRFAKQEDSLRTRLINSGIREGSDAWKSAFSQQGQDKNDAYNQLMLNGRGQAFNEALTERNQPINEISALLSGSQVSAPQFGATPQTGVAGVDYTGLVNNQYQAQLQSANAGMGGLFGLGGSLLGAAGNAGGFGALFSDSRLKTDVRRVGTTEDGTPIYTYRYIWGGPVQMGVMAQDVPEAAQLDPSGFLRVDYAKVH